MLRCVMVTNELPVYVLLAAELAALLASRTDGLAARHFGLRPFGETDHA
jgi:hypothetical protein